MIRQDLTNFRLTFLDANEDYPFDGDDAHSDDGAWMLMKHCANRKGIAHIFKRHDKLFINLKCDPFEADFLRRAFIDVTPAYYMNKEHWNTVKVGGDVP